MKIVNKGPLTTAPSPKDSFAMAVTAFDDKARKVITYDLDFTAPCLVRWGIPPFGRVRTHLHYFGEFIQVDAANMKIARPLCTELSNGLLQTEGVWAFKNT